MYSILTGCIDVLGAEFFNVPSGDNCEIYEMSYSNDKYESGEYVWNPQTGERVPSISYHIRDIVKFI